MIKHSEQELEQNYNNFITALKKVFSGERLSGLLKMYSMDELGPNLMLSPASSNVDYHNAYEGGYVDHVMHVVMNSMKVKKLYEEIGGICKFTQEELLFAAFHHDLGKLGTKGELGYIPNPSDWHVKNQGKIYIPNPDIMYMTATDRTFYLLSHYGIKYTQVEYMGIQLTDGLYDEDNKKYLITYGGKDIKTNIGNILHWGDHMSSCMEKDIKDNAPF